MTLHIPGLDLAAFAADPASASASAFLRLTASERIWVTATESIGDAVWVATRDGIDLPLDCIYLSPRLVQWLQPPGEPSDPGESRRLRERRLDLGAAPFVEDVGNRAPAAASMPASLRVGAVVEDVTHVHRAEVVMQEALELQRRAREDAERLSANKDEFISVVSHDLRSPLNAIRGWAHVLKLSSDLTAAQERALDAIDRNITAQTRMVDDLLDSQRILRGKLVLAFSQVALAELIDEAVETIRVAAEGKRIVIEVVHDRSIGSITADAVRLRQSLSNLLSNSLKFTPEDGRISVTSSRLEAPPARPGFVRVTVTDTGMGLTPDQIAHTFDPVMRADQPSGRRQGGLNLPLSLARQLIEMHGGTVSALSDGIDSGLSMSMDLPVVQL